MKKYGPEFPQPKAKKDEQRCQESIQEPKKSAERPETSSKRVTKTKAASSAGQSKPQIEGAESTPKRRRAGNNGDKS